MYHNIKKEKILLLEIISVPLIICAAFTPRFLFREVRISSELEQMVRSSGVRFETPLEYAKIVDYFGRWSHMYAKLDLPINEYIRLKQGFLQSQLTVTNKDFSEEILSEESQYRYDSRDFSSELSVMKNIKHMYRYHSMNLNEYEELFIVYRLYGEWFTTGENRYVLAKENDGAYYLYICA